MDEQKILNNFGFNFKIARMKLKMTQDDVIEKIKINTVIEDENGNTIVDDSKEDVKVEVQFRTIAMDFWASLEHKLRYKKEIKSASFIQSELKEVAELISVCDEKMQVIRRQIDILSNS